MTEGRFVSDIEEDIIAALSKSSLTIPELCDRLSRDSPWIVQRCAERLIAARKVALDPKASVNCKRWTTTTRAKALSGGDVDAE